MGVEQLDVVEDLAATAGAGAAVRPLVTDPRAPAARAPDQLHARIPLSRRTSPPSPTSEPRTSPALSPGSRRPVDALSVHVLGPRIRPVVRLHEFYQDANAPRAHDVLPAAFAAVRNAGGQVLLVRRIDD